MNSVSLIANLTADPELRTTPSGKSVTTLRVAYNDPFAGPDSSPEFFNVEVWGTQAENAVAHLTRGREIGIEGRLAHRPWEKDDIKHDKVLIVAQRIDYLRVPKGQQAPAGDPDATTSEQEIPV